jgi:hypothetical protein
LRLDLKSSGTGIADSATNAISGGYNSGQTYSIDTTVPTISGVTGPSAGTYKIGDHLNFTATFSEAVTVTGTRISR